jgi:hypothetical protein
MDTPWRLSGNDKPILGREAMRIFVALLFVIAVLCNVVDYLQNAKLRELGRRVTALEAKP